MTQVIKNTLPESEDVLAAKILHILSIFPAISPSMLQISLNVYASKWRPILEDHIARGAILRKFVVVPRPDGRHQTYTLLTLPSTNLSSMDLAYSPKEST